MLIGGAMANALAFTGSSYLFHRLSADNSCRLWHGSRGVFLKNRKISINYLFLRPYTHNLVKMQILQT